MTNGKYYICQVCHTEPLHYYIYCILYSVQYIYWQYTKSVNNLFLTKIFMDSIEKVCMYVQQVKYARLFPFRHKNILSVSSPPPHTPTYPLPFLYTIVKDPDPKDLHHYGGSGSIKFSMDPNPDPDMNLGNHSPLLLSQN